MVIHYRDECMDNRPKWMYMDAKTKIDTKLAHEVKPSNARRTKRKRMQKSKKNKNKQHLYCTGYLIRLRNHSGKKQSNQIAGSRTVTGVWASVEERRGEKRVLTARAFERCGKRTRWASSWWKSLDPTRNRDPKMVRFECTQKGLTD